MREAGCSADATIQLGRAKVAAPAVESCRSWRRVRLSFVIEGILEEYDPDFLDEDC